MHSNIDFLIVGAGFFGVTCARILTDAGYSCLIIEKRNHIGGLCYTERHASGLYDIHKYGPHIFHTSNYNVAQFISNYAKFNSYHHNIIALNKNKLYNLPFNMQTFNQLFGVITPEDAHKIINKETSEAQEKYKDRTDLEATAKKMVGETIFNTLIKGYTEKQWGKTCSELPGDIIKRLPIRYSYDNNYFNDIFFGIPKNGYTEVIENIINGKAYDNHLHNKIPYLCNVNFLDDIDKWTSIPNVGVIYCGPIDELMNYEFGELEWRTLRFENNSYSFNGKNGQGCSSINYVSDEIPQTRRIEHMYFTKEKWEPIINSINSFESVYTDEYPEKYEKGKERYYPINDEKNNALYEKYREALLGKYSKILLGGRLGLYKYLDMDDTISLAINISNNILEYVKNNEEKS